MIKQHYFIGDPDRENLLFGAPLDRAVAADEFRNRFERWLDEHGHNPRNSSELVDCANAFAVWSADDYGLTEYLERIKETAP